jgi:hypothetical protein
MGSWHALLAVYPGYVQQERHLKTWEDLYRCRGYIGSEYKCLLMCIMHTAILYIFLPYISMYYDYPLPTS